MALSKNESKRRKQLANLEKGKFKKGEITNPKGRPPKPKTMTAFIAEMKEKGYKISLRSQEYVNVATIAVMFGGGGHIRAAGANAIGTAEQIRDRVLTEIRKQLK